MKWLDLITCILFAFALNAVLLGTGMIAENHCWIVAFFVGLLWPGGFINKEEKNGDKNEQ